MRIRTWLWTLLSVACLSFGLMSQAQAEERTVKALSAWQGMGATFQVGKSDAFVVGAWGGLLFIEGGRGALDAAGLICPATVEINLRSGSRKGEGRCVITDADGDRVWAKWSCKGDARGCQGPFQLTGGTGKFTGISGTSTFNVRIAVRQIAGDPDVGTFQQMAAGLAVWPRLQYRIP